MKNSIKRRMQEFGINRAFIQRHHTCPSVVCNSIPKSGTNLLSRAFYVSGHYRRSFARTADFDARISAAKPNVFHTAHLRYSDEAMGYLHARGFKHIVIVRNPVDVIASNVPYILKTTSHVLHSYMTKELKRDFNKCFLAILDGVNDEKKELYTKSTVEIYHDYSGWLEDSQTLIIKFEDFAGPQRGGSELKQQMCKQNLQEYLGVSIFEKPLDPYSNDSRTFNSSNPYWWHELIPNSTLIYAQERLAEIKKIYDYV